MRGMYRTKSLKKKFLKTPGGRTVVHFKKKKTKPHRCAECGAILHMPKGRPFEIRRMKNRRPERPYGGYLCPQCLKKMLKEKVRA